MFVRSLKILYGTTAHECETVREMLEKYKKALSLLLLSFVVTQRLQFSLRCFMLTLNPIYFIH